MIDNKLVVEPSYQYRRHTYEHTTSDSPERI